MVPHDVKHIQTMGSTILSFYEILMMNMHYGCLDKCNASISTPLCENGGFPHPRNCSMCICPSGYSGNLCNERPSGCGKKLKATSSFQVLEDTVGGEAASDQIHDLLMCNYWIEAPAGSTIEVVIEKYEIAFDRSGCPLDGVEVKTGSDVRHTGYRYRSGLLKCCTSAKMPRKVQVLLYKE
ncbi:Astacin (Peptidase M12A) [Parelaphostrongylus tenuis]|uniref:Astacin (Peptidase M12A) n=1 Tax=Parelaphostrongylus tenuis TaxID=148309 RepID=A0AAD5MSF1_PARTN|nr:Astacin (Peptidase M12A) [Parelaphostrongylus tenuis]